MCKTEPTKIRKKNPGKIRDKFWDLKRFILLTSGPQTCRIGPHRDLGGSNPETNRFSKVSTWKPWALLGIHSFPLFGVPGQFFGNSVSLRSGQIYKFHQPKFSWNQKSLAFLGFQDGFVRSHQPIPRHLWRLSPFSTCRVRWEKKSPKTRPPVFTPRPLVSEAKNFTMPKIMIKVEYAYNHKYRHKKIQNIQLMEYTWSYP